MDFHGINTVGKIWLERINSKPVFNSDWEGRIIFALDNQTLSIGTSGGWIDIASATQGGISNPSVPVNAIVLFESDTALVGYSLMIDGEDDGVVYFTKGSAQGGETGGTAKIGYTNPATWTQEPHLHNLKHTIALNEMPYHNHPPQAGVANFMSSTGSSHGRGGDSYGVYGATGYAGSSQQMGYPNPNGIPTELGSPSSSWRPKGRNWTRQQKN